MTGDRPSFGADPSFLNLVRSMGAEPFGNANVPAGSGDAASLSSHGTTVIALRYADGVVMAGDRRATEGYYIADSRMDKVFQADEYSVVGIAGVAGQAIETVRLFQVELEHYEKVEGETLSLEGKANRLAQLLRASFALIMQGLVVVPIYAGYDTARNEGRIFRYDAIGGRYEETDYNATGSGGRDAKASLKKRWSPGLDKNAAIEAAVEALVDAGEADVATGGPDPTRDIFPSVFLATSEGVNEAPKDDVKAAFQAVLGRRENG
ncbi:MAG: proteasome subunit beta [Actinomycetota bacterium]